MSAIDYFGPEIAAFYDRDHCNHTDEEIAETVAFLSELAGRGKALEFAIGTGRVAIPLAKRGIPVSGIELSSAMVEKLRKKPGGSSIEVVLGDMAAAMVEDEFSLVYLVFNTLSNLTSQDAQTNCFINAAAHLRKGGFFVVENSVPPKSNERLRAFARSENHWGVDEIDTTSQRGISHHLWFDGGQMRRMSLPFRYVWPTEMDLMAQIAGFDFIERWSDWSRSQFTSESPSHVSVWQKNGDNLRE